MVRGCRGYKDGTDGDATTNATARTGKEGDYGVGDR